MNIFSKRFESYYLCKIYKPAVIYHHVYQCYCVTGVASPRGKLEIQQAKEEQLEISASGEEVSVWDVGDCPVIKTWSLASVTLPPPSINSPSKKPATPYLPCSWKPSNMPVSSTKGSYPTQRVLDISSGTAQVWGKVGPLLELFLKTIS